MSIIRTHKRVQAAKQVGLLHKNTLTNYEVIEQMIKDTGLSKSEAEDVLYALYKIFEKELSKKSGEISIHGFAKFYHEKFVAGTGLKFK